METFFYQEFVIITRSRRAHYFLDFFFVCDEENCLEVKKINWLHLTTG